MIRSYPALASHPLLSGVSFQRPNDTMRQRVTLESPAVEAMTDLIRVAAETIAPDASIEDANNWMIKRGVRLLLVIDADARILGIITAADILGEKPMQHITTHGGRRGELRVADIMTPQNRLEVLRMDDVYHARVGHIVTTLKLAGRQHSLVADSSPSGDQQIIRGIFSVSQIARQLGVNIETTEIAHTFAEIETMLVR